MYILLVLGLLFLFLFSQHFQTQEISQQKKILLLEGPKKISNEPSINEEKTQKKELKPRRARKTKILIIEEPSEVKEIVIEEIAAKPKKQRESALEKRNRLKDIQRPNDINGEKEAID